MRYRQPTPASVSRPSPLRVATLALISCRRSARPAAAGSSSSSASSSQRLVRDLVRARPRRSASAERRPDRLRGGGDRGRAAIAPGEHDPDRQRRRDPVRRDRAARLPHPRSPGRVRERAAARASRRDRDPGLDRCSRPRRGRSAAGGQCIYWLHTHAPDGVIHIESPTQRIYTLGNFFDEWRQPLSANQVGGVDRQGDGVRQRQAVDARIRATIPLDAARGDPARRRQPAVPFSRCPGRRVCSCRRSAPGPTRSRRGGRRRRRERRRRRIPSATAISTSTTRRSR